MGGEVVKAALYAPYCPVEEAVSSLVIDKLAYSMGQLLFAALGGVILVHEDPRQRIAEDR